MLPFAIFPWIQATGYSHLATVVFVCRHGNSRRLLRILADWSNDDAEEASVPVCLLSFLSCDICNLLTLHNDKSRDDTIRKSSLWAFYAQQQLSLTLCMETGSTVRDRKCLQRQDALRNRKTFWAHSLFPERAIMVPRIIYYPCEKSVMLLSTYVPQ